MSACTLGFYVLSLAACYGTAPGGAGELPNGGQSTSGPEHEGELDGDEVWCSDMPHEVVDHVTLAGGSLTVCAGTVVEFAYETALWVSTEPNTGADLYVEGTPDDPVVFRELGDGEAGGWSGLLVGPYANTVEIHDLELRNAGGYWGAGALLVDGAEVLVDGLTVTSSAQYGVFLTNGGAFADGSGGVRVRESAVAGGIGADTVQTLPTEDSDYTGNEQDAIHVWAGELSDDGTFHDPGVPYVVSGHLEYDGTASDPAVVTFEAGVTTMWPYEAALWIGANGGDAALVVEGTEDAPVVFTAADNAEPGAWSGIILAAATVDEETVLDHVEVEWAGGYWAGGSIHVEGSSPTIDHASLHDSARCGLYVAADADPRIGDVDYDDNAGGNLCRE